MDAKIKFLLRLTSPFHSGAGAVGNTAALRVQSGWSPRLREFVDVPVWSGGSLKHKIREACRKRLPLPKIVDAKIWHLIESGGVLKKNKGGVRLDMIRRVQEDCPSLSLVGYASGPTQMRGSRVDCSVVRLVCAEEQVPEDYASMPEAQHSCWAWRGDDEMVTCRESRPDYAKRLDPGVETVENEQMIAYFQVIRPGALLYGCVEAYDCDERELAALKLALHDIGLVEGGEVRIGARNSAGWGRAKVEMLSGSIDADVDAYLASLDGAKIIAILSEVVK